MPRVVAGLLAGSTIQHTEKCQARRATHECGQIFVRRGETVTTEPLTCTDHPYSQARRVGDLVFVSGALSVDEAFVPVRGVPASIEAATAGMARRLASVGASLEDVVKVTYFVTDVALRDDVNLHFADIFPHPRPARTFVEVSRLPYGADVEIDAVAHLAP